MAKYGTLNWYSSLCPTNGPHSTNAEVALFEFDNGEAGKLYIYPCSRCNALYATELPVEN